MKKLTFLNLLFVLFMGNALADNKFCDSRDGKVYTTTLIGTQTWMAENLNFDAGANSYCYDDDPNMCLEFGRLYTWALAMTGNVSSVSNPSGVQGICPEGWHLPSESQWQTLADYVAEKSGSTWGNDQGKYLKATSGWDLSNGTDDFSFKGIAGGARFSADSYSGHTLLHDLSKFKAKGYKKAYAFSVRCLKD